MRCYFVSFRVEELFCVDDIGVSEFLYDLQLPVFVPGVLEDLFDGDQLS